MKTLRKNNSGNIKGFISRHTPPCAAAQILVHVDSCSSIYLITMLTMLPQDSINGVEQNNDDRPRELILQSGHDLAEQFIVKYPRSFTMRFSDELVSVLRIILLGSKNCLRSGTLPNYN